MQKSVDIYRLEYDHYTAIQIESSSFAHKDKPPNNLVVILPQCSVAMREVWTLNSQHFLLSLCT